MPHQPEVATLTGLNLAMVETRSLVRAQSARKVESSETMSGVSIAYAVVAALALAPYVVPVPVFVQLIPTSIMLLYATPGSAPCFR